MALEWFVCFFLASLSIRVLVSSVHALINARIDFCLCEDVVVKHRKTMKKKD